MCSAISGGIDMNDTDPLREAQYFEYLENRASSYYPVLWLRHAYPELTRQEAIGVVNRWTASRAALTLPPAAPALEIPEPENLPETWDYHKSTNSVVCGGCSFRYGAEHSDGDGKWTCPNCGDGNGQPAAPALAIDSVNWRASLAKRIEAATVIGIETHYPNRTTIVNFIPTEKAEIVAALLSTNQPPSALESPVAWRWRPRGATNWIYDPTAEWRAQQKGADIDIEPLYVAAPALDRAANWQPMETVPKDIEVEVRGIWNLRGDGIEFTHWRPLDSDPQPVALAEESTAAMKRFLTPRREKE
jgi:hypothetical protein